MMTRIIESRIANAHLLLLTVVVAFLGTVSRSQAQVLILADNNSDVGINTGSASGMFSWSVDGQNRLAQQWLDIRLAGQQ